MIILTFKEVIHMWRYIIIILTLLLINDLVDNIEALERAYRKVGPLYSYTIDPDGTLRVDRGDGKPLKVRY